MPRSTNHRLMISEACFDVATLAIRAYSLETKKFESLHTAVRCGTARALFRTPSARQVATLLGEIEIHGLVRVNLVVTDRWSASFREAATRLSTAAGRALEVKECVYRHCHGKWCMPTARAIVAACKPSRMPAIAFRPR